MGYIIGVACALGLVVSLAPAAEPDLRDVRYGPHERNLLDVCKAAGHEAAPVIIYFHGGGFTGGDKTAFAAAADRYLKRGISVVSANCRFSRDAIYPGPMLDGARALQFVRSKAKEWNMDSRRVALSGGSAGATMSLWIALHDELADPRSRDPVARVSTRVACVTVKNAPTTLEPDLLVKYLGATEFRAWIHHPRFGEIMKQKYDELGLECRFYYRGKPAPPEAEARTFSAGI